MVFRYVPYCLMTAGWRRCKARSCFPADRAATGGGCAPAPGLRDHDSSGAATVLLLTGEPLHEPVVGYGPFVMNTQQEIRQAIEDYRNGKMGKLNPRTFPGA